MKPGPRGVLLALIAIAWIAGCGAGSPLQPAGEIPEILLKDLSGRKVSLSSYRGKVLLVDFWATWCAPCEESIPHLMKLQERYRDQGMTVLGIALDVGGAKVVAPYVEERKMNYPILLGDERTARAFGGIPGVPTSFVIDRSGQIVRRYVGLVDQDDYADLIQTLL